MRAASENLPQQLTQRRSLPEDAAPPSAAWLAVGTRPPTWCPCGCRWHVFAGLAFVVILPSLAPSHQSAAWVFTSFTYDAAFTVSLPLPPGAYAGLQLHATDPVGGLLVHALRLSLARRCCHVHWYYQLRPSDMVPAPPPPGCRASATRPSRFFWDCLGPNGPW